jgi:periplasmic protein TonB
MFESLALEDPRNTTRNWTTVASFILQTAAMGVLILAPIGYTGAISPRVAEPLVAPSGITEIETHEQPRPQHAPTPTAPSVFQDGRLTFTRIPPSIGTIVDRTPIVQPFDPNASPVIGGTNTTFSNAMDKLLDGMKPATTIAPPVSAHSKPYPISHLDAGMLIKQVQPVYPPLARAARIEGTVQLVAIIDTQGRITGLRALSGHPLLIPAAITAVQQWRYRPYILNSNPFEVETQVTVNFTLQK